MDILVTGCSLIYWIAMLWLASRCCARVPVLADLQAPPPARWPRVSLVVPARDEARVLGPAMGSWLQIAYPDLEIALVDDRSSDATPLIARAFASACARLRVIRVDELPAGWLGKVHAMQRGVEASSGPWLLFCDADVHVQPHALQQVIAYAEHHEIDHVAVFPRITATRGTLVVTLTTFLRQLFVGGRLDTAADPRSSASVGIGAFNLVRRRALERAGGLARLRMEINDDVALGRMLKRAGARQRLVNGCTDVSLQFVPSFRALTHTLEKNGATVPFPLVLVGMSGLSLLELGLLAGVFSRSPIALLLAAGAWMAASAATAYVTRWLGLPRWPAVVPFVGMVPLAWALVRASALAWWRDGVVWRGTFYRTDELRC